MIDIVKNIINQGEKINTEFKEATQKLPKNLFETVCAFLNRFGGNIILGVNDKKDIIGVDKNYVLQMKKDFANLCNNPQKISPTIYLKITDYEIDGKTVLHINVPDSPEVHRTGGRIYDRNEDGDFDITDNSNLVLDMYIRKKEIHIEDKIFPYATMENLREDLFEKARKWAILKNENHPWKNMTNEQIIKSSGLYREDVMTKEKGLTLAAILLFGKDEIIMSCLSHFKTDAIYRNENMDRYDDRDVIITNLIDSYERLMQFVQKHTNDKFYLEGSHSISIRDKIARELCCNLLIHRELTSGITSRMIITKDSIYTENPNIPRMRGFITVKNCIPYSKNPKIAKIFREIGLADELGSGVRNITNYSEIYSGREPIFEEGDIFKATVPLVKILNKMTVAEVNNMTVRELNEALVENSKAQDKAQDETQDKAQDEAHNEIDRKIIEFCNKERNIFQIMEHMGYKNRTRFRRDYIRPLVEKGLLKMTIPDKPTSKNQKYISLKN